MEQQNIGLDVTEAALDEIGKVGFDPLFGARPLRRAVQDYLENQIAVDIPVSYTHLDVYKRQRYERP